MDARQAETLDFRMFWLAYEDIIPISQVHGLRDLAADIERRIAVATA